MHRGWKPLPRKTDPRQVPLLEKPPVMTSMDQIRLFAISSKVIFHTRLMSLTG